MNRWISRPASLSNTELVVALTLKIALGCLYGYIYLTFYGGDDTWKINNASMRETKLLLSDPLQFLTNEYTPIHSILISSGWKEAVVLYLNDLQYALLVKSLAFVNLISGGNYYVNVAVFNVVTFVGHYKLFALLHGWYPQKRVPLFVAVFLYVPAVFWLSGLRIDGLLFLFITWFLYTLFSNRDYVKRRNAKLIIAFSGIFICRPEAALLMLPAVVVAMVVLRGGRPKLVIPIATAVFLLIFFGSAWLLPGGGLPGMVAGIQHKFLQLKGTRLPLSTLQPHFWSFAQVLPQAFANTLVRPLPWETASLLQLLASVDIVLFWVLAAMTFLIKEPDWKNRLANPVMLVVITFSLTLILSVGYVVPFPGAIIRYKAISILLLVSCMAVLIKRQHILKSYNV